MRKLLKQLNNRVDLSIIADWIEEGSSVLDLGCGRGLLLDYLIRQKKVRGMGVEIDLDRMIGCVEKGIPVVMHDLNTSFAHLSDQSFDYVILSQTIQEVKVPDQLMLEMLRIGKKVIVSFPNFGHAKVRWALLTTGRMPKNRALPYEWYNTPNIHLLTYRDFREFCRERSIRIEDTCYIRGQSFYRHLPMANWFAQGCVSLISSGVKNGEKN